MTEFGNMALVEERGDLEGGDVNVRLPGVKEGDMADRRVKPEFGNMALVEERGDLEGGDVNVRLPGVKEGDMADRRVKPEVI
ncbi:hypothetical protein PYW07_015729 [Mythimna separata]|uniref:Uncharacterized protein n=1 Tax=Mythimna separata TaxID=271217 RepID=A0AAD7YRZ1_MYTSE|nr:hypothetical protein PYW07_015727 [Mythimna separata]KAJ8724771.1 hypothetical protein PYW07_015729 [Mythimna separata]